MKKRVLLCGILIFIMCLSSVVYGDMGTYPSIYVKFHNIEGTTYYATLLSEKDSTGMYYAGQPYGGGEGLTREIWEKFCDYKDSDGFYFIGNLSNCSETNYLFWSMYPPYTFKVLLYFPENDIFYVSDIYEKNTYESYYDVDMTGVIDNQSKLILEETNNQNANETNNESIEESNNENVENTVTGEVKLVQDECIDYKHDLPGFIVRMLLTILIELAIALLVVGKDKKSLLVIIVANIVTQVILNILLFETNCIGFNMLALRYIIYELIVFIIEAAAYMTILTKVAANKKKIWVYVGYAAVANVVSFLLGFVVAGVCPLFF